MVTGMVSISPLTIGVPMTAPVSSVQVDRSVETQTEREKLMFRVKVKIAPELLARYKNIVKTGVPGVAYIRLDDTASWAAQLQPPPELL